MSGRCARAHSAGAFTDADQNYINLSLGQIFQDSGTTSMIQNAVQHPIQALRMMQHFVDGAARVGMHDRLTNAGFNGMRAASLSRQAFLDNAEARAGSLVNWWAGMVPFMSVSMRELDQVVNAFTRDPVGSGLKAGLIFVLPTMLNYAVNYLADKDLPEDEKYENRPQWEKDSYWVLPQIMGARIHIKKPYVGGAMFSATTERALEAMRRQDPHAFDGFMMDMVQQVLPPVVPTVVTPFVEQFANRSLYSGQPLVPDSMAKVSGYMQYKQNTSGAAIKLAQVLGPAQLGIANWSPPVIDNYINGWLGSMPMAALRALSQPWAPPQPPTTLMQQFANPFIGSFFSRNPGEGSQPLIDFYQKAGDYEAAQADMRLAKERGNLDEMRMAISQQHFMQVNQLREALHGQSAVLQGIYRNEGMTLEEKQKYTDSILSQQIDLAKLGLQLIQEAEKRAAQ